MSYAPGTLVVIVGFGAAAPREHSYIYLWATPNGRASLEPPPSRAYEGEIALVLASVPWSDQAWLLLLTTTTLGWSAHAKYITAISSGENIT